MIRSTHSTRPIPAACFVLSALIAGLAVPAAPAQADGYCSSYGVMCYRPWTPEERPGFLSRLRAADGDYMGSIFLPEGNCSCLNLGLNCHPCEDLPVENWSQVCNERFPECQGKCFAQPE